MLKNQHYPNPQTANTDVQNMKNHEKLLILLERLYSEIDVCLLEISNFNTYEESYTQSLIGPLLSVREELCECASAVPAHSSGDLSQKFKLFKTITAEQLTAGQSEYHFMPFVKSIISDLDYVAARASSQKVETG